MRVTDWVAIRTWLSYARGPEHLSELHDGEGMQPKLWFVQDD